MPQNQDEIFPPYSSNGLRRASATVPTRPLAERGWLAINSLRSRLVVIVLAIDCLAGALTGSVIIYKARAATQLEIASSMQLAALLVTDTIRLMNDAPASMLLQTIDLHFQSVRHVRIAVTDVDSHPVQAVLSSNSQAAQNARASEDAPAWFSRLIAPPEEIRVFPILVRNRLVGNVTITSEPSDEISEAWHYADTLLVTGSGLSLAVLVILFLLFGRVLAPLSALANGLTDLESRNFAVRLSRPSLIELAKITDHFNRTAEALSSANEANRTLNRKLLTAQDDERRRTALELHDEVGPCLFALDVNASSIAVLTKDLADGGRVHGRATDVVALCKRVQAINRRVLDRLRPMGLGHIPLKECVIKILVDFDVEPCPVIQHSIGPIEATYGFLVDLTIYRCVQEGLFNAIRHAHASRINLDVRERGDFGIDHRVDIRISDDGRGLAQPARSGIGLTGMRERVEALNGRFELTTSAKGTTLDISVPVQSQDTAPESRR